jgi:hypothetical protein
MLLILGMDLGLTPCLRLEGQTDSVVLKLFHNFVSWTCVPLTLLKVLVFICSIQFLYLNIFLLPSNAQQSLTTLVVIECFIHYRHDLVFHTFTHLF